MHVHKATHIHVSTRVCVAVTLRCSWIDWAPAADLPWVSLKPTNLHLLPSSSISSSNYLQQRLALNLKFEHQSFPLISIYILFLDQIKASVRLKPLHLSQEWLSQSFKAFVEPTDVQRSQQHFASVRLHHQGSQTLNRQHWRFTVSGTVFMFMRHLQGVRVLYIMHAAPHSAHCFPCLTDCLLFVTYSFLPDQILYFSSIPPLIFRSHCAFPPCPPNCFTPLPV